MRRLQISMDASKTGCGRVGTALVDDHLFGHMLRTDGLSKKTSCGCMISLGTQQKIAIVFPSQLTASTESQFAHRTSLSAHHRSRTGRILINSKELSRHERVPRAGHHLLDVPQARWTGGEARKATSPAGHDCA